MIFLKSIHQNTEQKERYACNYTIAKNADFQLINKNYTQNVKIRTSNNIFILRCSVKRKDALKNFAKFTEKLCCRNLFYNEVAGWKTETFRTSLWRCSVKQGVLKKVTAT